MSMTTRRAPFDPRSFGRRERFAAAAVAAPAPILSDDLKLFLLTYVAGFVFVSLWLA